MFSRDHLAIESISLTLEPDKRSILGIGVKAWTFIIESSLFISILKHIITLSHF